MVDFRYQISSSSDCSTNDSIAGVISIQFRTLQGHCLVLTAPQAESMSPHASLRISVLNQPSLTIAGRA